MPLGFSSRPILSLDNHSPLEKWLLGCCWIWVDTEHLTLRHQVTVGSGHSIMNRVLSVLSKHTTACAAAFHYTTEAIYIRLGLSRSCDSSKLHEHWFRHLLDLFLYCLLLNSHRELHTSFLLPVNGEESTMGLFMDGCASQSLADRSRLLLHYNSFGE